MKNVAKQDEQSTEYWKQKCANLELLVKSYENQLLLMKQKQFGKSSERHLLDGQIFLFNEAEFVANPNIPEPTIEEITYTRKKSKGKREEDLSELAVERIEYELSKEEQVCPECNGELHVFGHEVRKEVEIIPAQFKVVEHSRATYSCRYCEKHNDHVPIIKAVIPKPVISGSVASPSAVAHVMVQKYVNAMPLYRQEQDYLRNGFTLSRQTMANWMIKCSQDWLEPLYERLKELLVKREVAHADETTLQVLKEPGKSPSSKSYMWLYQTCNDTNQHIILYEYQQSRAGYHPKEFLKDFIGYLHTDGYGVYHSLSENITVVGCWAHYPRSMIIREESLESA